MGFFVRRTICCMLYVLYIFQVSGLYGGLYLLESHIPSVVSLVIPLVTDYITKVLALVTE